MRKVTAKLYDSDAVFVADLVFEGSGTSYDRRINQSGVAQITVAAAAAVSSELQYERYVRFFEDDTAVFTMIIEELDVTISGTTPNTAVVVAKGRGWIAELANGRVYPANGVESLPVAENVTFNYSHELVDRTSWSTPTWDQSMFLLDSGPTPPANPKPPPKGWPDIFSVWMSAGARDGSNSHPAGQYSYFTNYFYAPVTADAAFIVTSDDKGWHWIDNCLLLETDDWRNAYSIGVLLTEGWHRYTVKVWNVQRPTGFPNTDNPSCTSVVGYQQVNSRYLINENLILRSSSLEAHGYLHPDDDTWLGWLCDGFYEANDTPPGLTAGQIMSFLIDTEQAIGGLEGWSASFNDTQDSRGTAWPIIPEFVARVGDDLLTVFTQLAEQGHVDFAADPSSKTIHAWLSSQQGNYYTTPGSRPVLAGSNISSLNVKGRR